jgi:ribosomal-protein-alanine N-acetyltransferase
MIILKKPLLLTRFYLRHLTSKDATSEYLSWFDDDRVVDFIDYAKQRHDKRDLKTYIRARNSSALCCFLGIFTISDDVHIGNIKYEPIDFTALSAEMGILIGSKSHRGIGVGPEVISGSTLFLQQLMGLKSITLGVRSDNTQAVRAYEKIGYTISRETSDADNKGLLRMIHEL